MKFDSGLTILFLNKFFYPKGGAERIFFEEMSLMRKHGHNAIPFSRLHSNNDPTEYNTFFAGEFSGDTSTSLRSLKAAFEIVYSFAAKKSLGRMLSHVQPDVAHAHNIYGLLTTSVIDELYSKGIPIILSLHDYKIICPNYQFLRGTNICEDCKTHRYYKAVQNRCVHGSIAYSLVYAVESYFNLLTKKYRNRISKYVAVSEFIKDKFVEYGFPKEEIVVIPNFVNVDDYRPTYENHRYFLYFGRLSMEKGVQTLIDAHIAKKSKGYKLVIAGEGPLLNDLVQKADIAGFDDIQFTGFLVGDALENTIRNCTAVVVPSVCYENCPMSLLESLAYGKPVIGANIGGIPELIEDGTDGMIFESGNVADLATKMDAMAGLSEQELARLGRNGRMKIESRYNQDQHYDQLLSLYESVLDK